MGHAGRVHAASPRSGPRSTTPARDSPSPARCSPASDPLFGVVGLVILIRGRIPGGDRAALLDAAILASGTGVLIWAFGFAPFVARRPTELARRRRLLLPGPRRAGDGRPDVVPPRRAPPGDAPHRPVRPRLERDHRRRHAGGPASTTATSLRRTCSPHSRSLTLVGAAALHPSMAIAPERQRVDLRPVSRRRIVALTAALLVNPATLAIEVLVGRQIDPAPYLIGGVVIGLLVIARLGDALRQLGESLHERDSLMELLRRQALYDALTSLPNRSLFTERLAADFANRSDERTAGRPARRPRRLQGRQRQLRPRGGRRAPGRRRPATARRDPRRRHRGPPRWRRVRHRPAGLRRPARPGARRPADPGIAERTVRRRRSSADRRGPASAWPSPRRDDRTADDLVRNADVAMYLAKSRGKGRIEVFEPSMQEAAMTQLQLRTDLAVGDRRAATFGSTTSRSSTCGPAGPSATRRSFAGCATAGSSRRGEFIPIGRIERPDRPADGLGRRRGLPDDRRRGDARRSPVGQRQPVVEPARPPGHRRPLRRRASTRAAWRRIAW